MFDKRLNSSRLRLRKPSASSWKEGLMARIVSDLEETFLETHDAFECMLNDEGLA